MPDLRERAAEVCGPYDVWVMIAISIIAIPIKKLGPLVGPSFLVL